jgi:hypothetical protein
LHTTLRTFRAERSEIAAQPTLSTTAKRQQLAQAQGQRASAAKAEDDAPQAAEVDVRL